MATFRGYFTFSNLLDYTRRTLYFFYKNNFIKTRGSFLLKI